MSDRIDVTGHGSVDETPDVLAASLAAEASSGSVSAALAAADAGFRAMTAAREGERRSAWPTRPTCWWRRASGPSPMRASAKALAFEPGTATVSASVTVRFELV